MSQSYISEIYFQSAPEFLNYIRPCADHWTEGMESPWVFRGHGDASWALLPSAFRDSGKKVLDSITDTHPTLTDSLRDSLWAKLVKKYSWIEAISKDQALSRFEAAYNLLFSERAAVSHFAELADELGFRIPARPDYLMDLVKFSTPTYYTPTPAVSLPTPIWGFAQHHGIPTQLLDWTRHPLVAAFFAANHKPFDNDRTHICVWAIHGRCLRENGVLQMMTCERADHSYLHAQSGFFIYFQNALIEYVKTGKWTPFEDIFSRDNAAYADRVRKLMLPVREAPHLLKLLWLEKISQAHLMPTLDNINKSLRMRWDIGLLW